MDDERTHQSAKSKAKQSEAKQSKASPEKRFISVLHDVYRVVLQAKFGKKHTLMPLLANTEITKKVLSILVMTYRALELWLKNKISTNWVRGIRDITPSGNRFFLTGYLNCCWTQYYQPQQNMRDTERCTHLS